MGGSEDSLGPSLWLVNLGTHTSQSPVFFGMCPREALTLTLGPQDLKLSVCPSPAFLNTLSVYYVLKNIAGEGRVITVS